MSDEISSKSTGTARVLHELREYEELENDYDEEVALSITAKAFQKHDPKISRQDLKSAIKVIRAAKTGKVSVARERQIAEEKAKVATIKILHQFTSEVHEKEKV